MKMLNTNALIQKFTVATLENGYPSDNVMQMLDSYSVASSTEAEGWFDTLEYAALNVLGWDESEIAQANEDEFYEFEYKVLETLFDLHSCRAVVVNFDNADIPSIYILKADAKKQLERYDLIIESI